MVYEKADGYDQFLMTDDKDETVSRLLRKSLHMLTSPIIDYRG